MTSEWISLSARAIGFHQAQRTSRFASEEALGMGIRLRYQVICTTTEEILLKKYKISSDNVDSMDRFVANSQQLK